MQIMKVRRLVTLLALTSALYSVETASVVYAQLFICGDAHGPPPNNDVCVSEGSCQGKSTGANCGTNGVCVDQTPDGFSGICCACLKKVPTLSAWAIGGLIISLLGAMTLMFRRLFMARGQEG